MDHGGAIEVLERANEKFEFPVHWGVDLQSEHERYLTEKHAKKPVIVMNYPKDIKAFYLRLNDDGRTVAAMDVLAPGIGEIIGGSQREERLDVLDRSMAERGIDGELYAPNPSLEITEITLTVYFIGCADSAVRSRPSGSSRAERRSRDRRGRTAVPSFAEPVKLLSATHEQAPGTSNRSRAPATRGLPG
jgi:hypothetical protein